MYNVKRKYVVIKLYCFCCFVKNRHKPIYKPISHLVWLVLLRQLPSHFLKSRLVFTLTTPNEVLTKRIDIHFTRSLGTFPLSRVSSHSLSSPKASIYKKKPSRVWELRFFPSIGSSFYSHKLFVVNFTSFVAKVR